MRRAIVAGLAIACVIAGPTVFAQTRAPEPVVVDVAVSSAEMSRNAALATAGGQALNRLADISLDKLFGQRGGTGWKQVAGRVAAVYFVALPVAAFGHTLAHEVGHIARIHEVGAGVDRVRINHWPWPVPYLRAEVFLGSAAADGLSNQEWLAVIGGGSEASQLQVDALVDSLYSRDRANYFDWILLASAKLDMPLYIWRDLRSAHVRDLGAFYDPQQLFGDPRAYVLNFATIREEARGYDEPGIDAIRAASSDLRHGAWWNLADFSLWAGVTRAATYIATGARETDNPVLSVRGIGVLPAAHFVLTPLGPERGLGVRTVSSSVLAHVDVRWIDPPTGTRLWAGGLSLLPRMRTGFAPEFRADIWQRGGDRPGLRIEVGGRRDLHLGGRTIGAHFDVGYKSSGYLAGAPSRRGPLASIGGTIKF